MLDLGEFSFDPRSPSFLMDPYPVFHVLRQFAPVWRVPFARWNVAHYDWILTRYDDCALVLRDRRFGKSEPEELLQRFGPTALQEPAVVELLHMMVTHNPPDHTRLRSLVIKAFTSRRIEKLRSRIQDMTERLLDKVAMDGQVEAISNLAVPLSVSVICELLGIPEEDRARFVTGAMTGMALMEPTPSTREMLDAANAASEESRTYFEALFNARRRHPQDDLITQLVQAEEAGDRLTMDELRANVRMIFVGGHETTVNLIGNGLLALLRHPEQWGVLRSNAALVPNAIEELLRFDAPVQAIPRVVLEPVELDGVTLERHELVAVLLGAANRDGTVFVDPDRLDVTRKNVRPLAFGTGIHFCLGAQLARLEATVVLETLLRRLPGLRLKEAINPSWRPSLFLRGLTELPLIWS